MLTPHNHPAASHPPQGDTDLSSAPTEVNLSDATVNNSQRPLPAVAKGYARHTSGHTPIPADVAAWYVNNPYGEPTPAGALANAHKPWKPYLNGAKNWCLQNEHTLASLAVSVALGVLVAMNALQPLPLMVLAAWALCMLGAWLLCKQLWVLKGLALLSTFWVSVCLCTCLHKPHQLLPFALGPVKWSGWVVRQHPCVVAIQHLSPLTPQPGSTMNSGLLVMLKGKTLNNTPLSDLAVGQAISGTGKLRLPFSATLPNTFDEKRYLASQQIHAVLTPIAITPVAFSQAALAPDQAQAAAGGGFSPIVSWCDGIRQQLANALSHTFAPNQEAAALMGGLLLGDDALPLATSYHHALLKAGVLHVVSASGANLMFMATLVLLLTRGMALRRNKAPLADDVLPLASATSRGVNATSVNLLPINLWAIWSRRALVVLTVTGYAMLTGWPPSIQRAYAMLAVGAGLRWLGLPLQPLTLLLLAVAGLLLVQPSLAYSVGFQLSVLATMGILGLVPSKHAGHCAVSTPKHGANSTPKLTANTSAKTANQTAYGTVQWPTGWRLWVGVPLAAELAVCPWAGHIFHQFSWATLPVNMLVDGLLLPLTWLAAIGGVLVGLGNTFSVLGVIGSFVWQLAWPFIAIFNGLIGWVNQWPGVLQTIPSWPLTSLLAWYAGLWGWKFLPVNPWRRPLLAACVAMVLLPWGLSAWMHQHPYRMVVDLNEGEQLAILHRTGLSELTTSQQTDFCTHRPAHWAFWHERSLKHFLQAEGLPPYAGQPCNNGH
jgi:predicted membrane metal-binding protein